MKYYERKKKIEISFCCVEMQLLYTGKSVYMDAEMKEMSVGEFSEIKHCPYCGAPIQIHYENPTI
jgi:uncharacterized protein YbbK (DUF523 family)